LPTGRARTIAGRLKSAVDVAAGLATVALLRLVRLTNPAGIANFAGGLLARIGPWLPEHRVARNNLMAAFPEKSPAEIDAILRQSWNNLGRVAAEYPHLDDIFKQYPEAPERNRIYYSAQIAARYCEMRDDGKPALIFAAHLANWELPAIAATTWGIESTVLYRPPSIGNIADAINRIRAVNMGTLVAAAPDTGIRLAAALERNSHVGMLVDQHHSRGVDVTFFGRVCKANPLMARLAQHIDCPIYGVRSIRMPDNRFQLDITPAMAPVRKADGSVDVTATMQAITSVIEAWVREHPEQWLWQHRRWR
jgi:KDO2-lipid IV(A) lauroyltransferase